MPKDGTLQDQDSPLARANENIALWKLLSRTDPRATKPFKRPGFQGTQVDPVWRYQHMTEVFGPIGKGWGYEQTEHLIAEGMVFVCVRCWWRDRQTGEVHYTGPQWGGDTLFKARKEGPPAPNDEAFKMAMTDAIGKALVTLGVAADIYLKQFDDSKYREETEAYYAARENPALSPEAVAKFDEETKGKVGDCTTLESLDELWRGGVSAHLREVGKVDRAAQQRIVAYFSERKAELLGGTKKPAAAPRDEAFFARDSYRIDPKTVGGTLGGWETAFRQKLAECKAAKEQQKLEADNNDLIDKLVDKSPTKANALRDHMNELWERFTDEPALDALANGKATNGHAAEPPSRFV